MGNPHRSGHLGPVQLNQHLRNRLPSHLRHTFTEEQLTAIRQTYNTISRGNTPIIDHRITFPFPGGRLYSVVVLGCDLRSKTRTSTTRTGVTRTGTTQTGSAQTGETLTGQVRTGQVRTDISRTTKMQTNMTRANMTRANMKRAVKTRLLMALCVTLGCSSMLGLVKLRHVYSTRAYRSTLNSGKPKVHPTTVPFKHDKTACETSGREWQKGECVDHEHSPTF